VIGEGGIKPLTPAFAAAIKAACARTGALFIAGRNPERPRPDGYPFYFQALGLEPHLVSSARRSAAACRLAPRWSARRWPTRLSFGDHGTTYGGNLLACRAALFVLGEIFDGGVGDNVKKVGAIFEQRLRALKAKHAIVKEVRGAGLMWGLELTRDAAAVVPAGLARGVIVNRTAETVVRLLPPLGHH
jgi:acetylornithine/succinyldiaminopimelate/putrescine aminotransferase